MNVLNSPGDLGVLNKAKENMKTKQSVVLNVKNWDQTENAVSSNNTDTLNDVSMEDIIDERLNQSTSKRKKLIDKGHGGGKTRKTLQTPLMMWRSRLS